MNFAEYLNLVPKSRLLIQNRSAKLSRYDLLATVSPDDKARLRGIRLAICLSDIGSAVRVLAQLDGAAEIILILSPQTEPELATKLVSRANVDAVLSDKPAQFSNCQMSVPVYDDLSLIPSKPSPTSETQWILSTSGTTGTPKLVAHTFSGLIKTARTDVNRGATNVWGMLYDYTRFAGLQVMLQSTLSGGCLLEPDYSEALEDKINFFAENKCTHLSGTPTLWRKVLMSPCAKKLSLKQVTMGGEIADDRVLSAAAACFPGARVAHIFASTEAGVGLSVSDGLAGFPAAYLDTPPFGIELKISNNRLYVRNPQVAPTYLGSDVSFAEDDSWIDTGDAVIRTDDRVLFLGRESGVINVGGDKVHPEEVETVLMAHPQVSAALVYGKSNPITGQLVIAEILPLADTVDKKELSADLKRLAADKLERFKRPALIRFVTDFERNPSGKIVRK